MHSHTVHILVVTPGHACRLEFGFMTACFNYQHARYTVLRNSVRWLPKSVCNRSECA